MNETKKLYIQIFKPNIISLINSNILEQNLRKITEKILSKIIKSNKYTNKYLSNHIKNFSIISYSLLNNIFYKYYSSSLSDFLYNLFKISTYNNNYPLSFKKNFCLSKTLYLIEQLINPIILEKISKKYFGKIIIKGLKITDIIFKLLYMIKDNFMYTNLIDYIFGIITLNDENVSLNNNQMKIICLFIYFLCFIGNSYYKKLIKNKIKIVKNQKEIIKVINENYKIEVLPPPSKIIFFERNNNFYKKLKNKNGLCLICCNKFNVPTAIKCCGGVFCNKCIYNYLLYNNKCFLCNNDYIFQNELKIKEILIRIYS